MANSDHSDDADLPTKPLPTNEPIAAHVPVTDLPTAPLVPVAGLPSSEDAPRPRRQVWPWVILATLAVAVVATVVGGLYLGNRGPSVAPSPSLSITPSTVASAIPTAPTRLPISPSQPAPPPPSAPPPSAPPSSPAPPDPSGTPSP